MLLGKFFFSLCAWFVRMGEGYRSISNKIVVYEYWIVQSVIYYFSSLIFIIARLLYIINANHVFLWEHVLTWVHLGNYTNPICLLPVVRQGQLSGQWFRAMWWSILPSSLLTVGFLCVPGTLSDRFFRFVRYNDKVKAMYMYNIDHFRKKTEKIRFPRNDLKDRLTFINFNNLNSVY